MRTEKTKFLIQGILLIIFGIMFIMNPIINVALFTLIVGILFVIAGVVTVFDGLFITSGIKYKIFRILEGLLLGAFGLIFFLRNPASGALIMVYTVIWAMIFLSIMNTAMVFGSQNKMKWLSIILNIIVIYLGVLALLDPALAITIFYWSVAFQLIFMGINHISMYFVLSDTEES